MLSEVLDLVNKGRAAVDLAPLSELPLGRPGDTCRCVIAEAFDGAYTRGSSISYHDKSENLAKVWGTKMLAGGRVTLPKTLQEFIRDFDHGEYPELLSVAYNPHQFNIFANEAGSYCWYGPTGFRSRYFPTREEAHAHLITFLSKLPR